METYCVVCQQVSMFKQSNPKHERKPSVRVSKEIIDCLATYGVEIDAAQSLVHKVCRRLSNYKRKFDQLYGKKPQVAIRAQDSGRDHSLESHSAIKLVIKRYPNFFEEGSQNGKKPQVVIQAQNSGRDHSLESQNAIKLMIKRYPNFFKEGSQNGERVWRCGIKDLHQLSHGAPRVIYSTNVSDRALTRDAWLALWTRIKEKAQGEPDRKKLYIVESCREFELGPLGEGKVVLVIQARNSAHKERERGASLLPGQSNQASACSKIGGGGGAAAPTAQPSTGTGVDGGGDQAATAPAPGQAERGGHPVPSRPGDSTPAAAGAPTAPQPSTGAGSAGAPAVQPPAAAVAAIAPPGVESAGGQQAAARRRKRPLGAPPKDPTMKALRERGVDQKSEEYKAAVTAARRRMKTERERRKRAELKAHRVQQKEEQKTALSRARSELQDASQLIKSLKQRIDELRQELAVSKYAYSQCTEECREQRRVRLDAEEEKSFGGAEMQVEQRGCSGASQNQKRKMLLDPPSTSHLLKGVDGSMRDKRRGDLRHEVVHLFREENQEGDEQRTGSRDNKTATHQVVVGDTSLPSQLTVLANLRETGMLTEEEFVKAKAKLLLF